MRPLGTAALGWFVPHGRRSRSDWWIGYLLAFVLLGVLAAFADSWLFPGHVALRVPDDRPDLLFFLPDTSGPVTSALGTVLVVPYVGGTVTRLHDRDHSAWWLLWLVLGPIGVVVLVVTCGLLGTRPEPNRYGLPR